MLGGVRLVWRNSASQIFVYFLSGISIRGRRIPPSERRRRVPAPGWFCRSSGRSNLLPPRGKWPKADRGDNHRMTPLPVSDCGQPDTTSPRGGGKEGAAISRPLCSYSMKMLSSFSTQSETGMVRYSVGLWRITTRSMPALMICRLHMEQLMASLSSSPVLASRPTR